jgi:hypothetical protein
MYDYQRPKTDYVPIWLGIMAVCSIVTVIISGTGMFAAIQRMDESGEHQRGRLFAQSEAHRFILHRVSPGAATAYVKWVEDKK